MIGKLRNIYMYFPHPIYLNGDVEKVVCINSSVESTGSMESFIFIMKNGDVYQSKPNGVVTDTDNTLYAGVLGLALDQFKGTLYKDYSVLTSYPILYKWQITNVKDVISTLNGLFVFQNDGTLLGFGKNSGCRFIKTISDSKLYSKGYGDDFGHTAINVPVVCGAKNIDWLESTNEYTTFYSINGEVYSIGYVTDGGLRDYSGVYDSNLGKISIQNVNRMVCMPNMSSYLSYNFIVTNTGELYSNSPYSGAQGIGYKATIVNKLSLNTIRKSYIDNVSNVQIHRTSSSYIFIIILDTEGNVYISGNNNPVTQSTTSAYAYLPLKINGITGVKKVISFNTSLVFLKNDGTVWTCGKSEYGLLGRNVEIVANSSIYYKPAPIQGISNAKDIIKIDDNAYVITLNSGESYGVGVRDKMGIGQSSYSKGVVKLPFINIKNVAFNSTQTIYCLDNGYVYVVTKSKWVDGIGSDTPELYIPLKPVLKELE